MSDIQTLVNDLEKIVGEAQLVLFKQPWAVKPQEFVTSVMHSMSELLAKGGGTVMLQTNGKMIPMSLDRDTAQFTLEKIVSPISNFVDELGRATTEWRKGCEKRAKNELQLQALTVRLAHLQGLAPLRVQAMRFNGDPPPEVEHMPAAETPIALFEHVAAKPWPLPEIKNPRVSTRLQISDGPAIPDTTATAMRWQFALANVRQSATPLTYAFMTGRRLQVVSGSERRFFVFEDTLLPDASEFHFARAAAYSGLAFCAGPLGKMKGSFSLVGGQLAPL